MTAVAHAGSGSVMRAYTSGRRAYRIVFGAASAVFVAVTLVDRLNPLHRGRSMGRSILAEARARAAATVPFIFMG